MWRGVWTEPPQHQGYYRGEPHAGGQGSMAGPAMQGVGISAAGQSGSYGGWHPTVVYIGILVLAEMAVFGWLSRLGL